MEETRFDAITRLIAQLTSRRTAVRSLGVAGVGSALGTLLLGQDDVDAKKKQKKRSTRSTRKRSANRRRASAARNASR